MGYLLRSVVRDKRVVRSTAERPDRPTAREEFELWTLLSQVNDGMLRVRDRELESLDTSTVQVAILYALANGGHPMTQSELAIWVFRKPHTVAASLKRMEGRGLIVQSRVPNGRRQMKVEMTEKGLAVFRRQHRQREAIPRVLSSLAPHERHLLLALLKRLRSSTMAEMVDRPPFP
jgi:DNA-binding MarR family transcriptional regulator